MRPSAQLWFGAGALLIAIALGVAVTAGWPEHPSVLDEWWNDAMIAARPAVLVGFSRVMNSLGGGWLATIVIPLGIAAALLIARQWRAAVYALVAFLISAGVVQLLKNLFARARPEEMLVHSDFGSFPSGHTSHAATIAVVIWLLFPRVWVWLLGVLWVLAMAFSRTVLSVHWLTDTVGGALVGAGAALLVGAVLLPWVRDRPDPGDTMARLS